MNHYKCIWYRHLLVLSSHSLTWLLFFKWQEFHSFEVKVRTSHAILFLPIIQCLQLQLMSVAIIFGQSTLSRMLFVKSFPTTHTRGVIKETGTVESLIVAFSD